VYRHVHAATMHCGKNLRENKAFINTPLTYFYLNKILGLMMRSAT